MNNNNGLINNSQVVDPTKPISGFLDHILKTLDQQITAQSPPNLILPQLHQQPRIVINGEPFGSKEQFQKLWSSLPLSQHIVTSYDAHVIPNSNQYLVLAHLKVKFDESGTNKLGESANFNNTGPQRSIWSHPFGVVLSLIVDGSITQGFDRECISSWDYRFTEKPDTALFNIA